LPPDFAVGLGVVGEPHQVVCAAVIGQLELDLVDDRKSAIRKQFDGKHVGNRRVLILAGRERILAPHHQKTAAAFRHEIHHHLELFRTKEGGLNASKNDAGVFEEVLLLLGKTILKRVLVVDPLTVELVLGRPQQGFHHEVRIIGDCPASEFVFPSRFTFDIEQLRVVVADRHERIENIVLGDSVLGNANREREDLVAFILDGNVDGSLADLTVGRERNRMLLFESAILTHVNEGLVSLQTCTLELNVNNRRGVLQHFPRGCDSNDFRITGNRFGSYADRIERCRPPLQVVQRLIELLRSVVDSVGHQDDAGQRQRSHFLLQHVGDGFQAGSGSIETKLLGGFDPPGFLVELKEANLELFGKLLEELGLFYLLQQQILA
jgi:hypothetical protein